MADRRERLSGDSAHVRLNLLLAALEGWEAELWTAMPGVVIDVQPAALTCSVQPAILAVLTQPDGTEVTTKMPVIPDVPICFPGGGGFTMTFPVQAGDEGLIIFADRCIDAWWQSGNPGNPPQPQPQVERRMHDLSDAFFIPGVRSQVRLPSGGYNATKAQLRSDDGTVVIEAGAGEITLSAATINLTATTQIVMTAPTIKEN